MTAAEIPVGGRFSLPGDETVYTVLVQCRGRMADLTETQSMNPFLGYLVETTFAGHTEVIAHPETTATARTQQQDTA